MIWGGVRGVEGSGKEFGKRSGRVWGIGAEEVQEQLGVTGSGREWEGVERG